MDRFIIEEIREKLALIEQSLDEINILLGDLYDTVDILEEEEEEDYIWTIPDKQN